MAKISVASSFEFSIDTINFNTLNFASNYVREPDYFAAAYSNGYVDAFFGSNFKYSPEGYPASGIVTSYEGSALGTFLFSIKGISINARDLIAVARTANRSDDLQLIKKYLEGADRFAGSNLDDTFRSFGGNDTLRGNGGADKLNGGAGNDLIYGGNGADLLAGGIGADSFYFTTKVSAADRDRVADFEKSDTFFLENAVFSGLRPGKLNPEAFVLGTKAIEKDDHILYNRANGELSFDVDGSGKIKPILFADLLNKAMLTAADFFVI
jgi:Ca2+-binding RTX toxin-like protein